MSKKALRSTICLIICLIVALCSVLSVSALDDKYYIEDIGITLKIPKEYTVITRDTQKGDGVFHTMNLDYDETMTAYKTANIYLQAFSEDKILKLELTSTQDANSQKIVSYNDLSDAQRQNVLDAYKSDKSNNRVYTSGVEKKHNGDVYFDFTFTQTSHNGAQIYGYLCNTVINGRHYNLALTKNKEDLTADEIKVITNIADNIEYDKNGPSLDWWRILLWIAILVLIVILANYLYKYYNKRVKIKSSKKPLKDADESMPDTDYLLASYSEEETKRENKQRLLYELGFSDEQEDELSFDQMLGYDTTDYYERANTDIDTFDVKVKGKNRSKGVSYFEDDGKDINQKGDYFDEYFSESTTPRSATKRVFSNIGLYIKLAFVHLGYFFTNLWRMIFLSKKSKHRRKRK